MGNCLKTQLKQEVQNENLRKFGHIILGGISASNGFVNIYPKVGGGTLSITLLEGSVDRTTSGAEKIDSTHVTITGTTSGVGFFTTTVNQNILMDVSIYYDIAFIPRLRIDNDVDLLENTTVSIIEVKPDPTAKFNVNVLSKLTELSELSLGIGDTGNNFYGDLSFISNFTNLTTFKLLLVNADNTELIFDPELLSNLINLTVLNLDNVRIASTYKNITIYGKLVNTTILHLQGTKTYGTVEDFVAAQIANGRTTCTGINIGANMGANVTFQGSAISGSQAKVLSWTSASNISIINA